MISTKIVTIYRPAIKQFREFLGYQPIYPMAGNTKQLNDRAHEPI